MAFLNDHYLKLKAGYLFPEIARRVNTYAAENPSTAKNIIRCGIGDVTEPLPAAVRQAMHHAVDEMGQRDTFRGYGPEQGYEFLRQAIAENDYRGRGLSITGDEMLHAHECAMEFRSFSKNGGFTGVRCGFTVLPKKLLASTSSGENRPLSPLWHRRFSTKFNSVSYPVQRAAEAIYTADGKKQVRKLIEHYLGNAEILSSALAKTDLRVFGGRNAPYIWVQAPTDYQSWDVFDKVLKEIQVVITPGAGFGSQGEGYFRVSAFNSRQNAEEVARRFQALNG